MRFKPEEVNREAVAACFAEHRAAIEALIGGAQVEHVGSTAVPGALTKGDLDLLVRVPEERFSDAIDSLRSLYSVDQPENWSSTFASFRQEPGGDVPVGIQAVIAGSGDDSLFLEWRERLRSEPDLLERFNDFKRSQVGADPDRYVAAKARFIEGVLGRTPNTD